MNLISNFGISVVMATYNGMPYLSEQLRSVLAQLLPDDELIIVDDGSQDGSLELINDLLSPLVRCVRNSQNLGVIGTFERGLLMSSNDIVFLCDQDDVWLPGKRDAVVQAFDKDPNLWIVISDAELIDARGEVTEPSFMAMRGGFRGSFWQTMVSNRYLGCAMAVRRELLCVALPIPRQVPMHDMWFGALASMLGSVHFIPRPLIQYRRHDGNASPSRSQNWMRMVRWRVALVLALTARLLGRVVAAHVPQWLKPEQPRVPKE
jgi:glycosyltransferase involved in cell wall biosynthesis